MFVRESKNFVLLISISTRALPTGDAFLLKVDDLEVNFPPKVVSDKPHSCVNYVKLYGSFKALSCVFIPVLYLVPEDILALLWRFAVKKKSQVVICHLAPLSFLSHLIEVFNE